MEDTRDVRVLNVSSAVTRLGPSDLTAAKGLDLAAAILAKVYPEVPQEAMREHISKMLSDQRIPAA